jgi:two-component system sensor kinase FixL
MTMKNPHEWMYFDALMDAAVDAIIIIDQKGTIQRLNQSAQELFGFSDTEILGRNISQLMPEPDRSQHDKYLQKYSETGRAAIIGVGREVKGRHKNGEIFPMRLSVGESRHENTSQFVGIIHDLSSRDKTKEKIHRLEKQLLHADRLLTLGELTAGIAHEINQPLTAIAAYADAAHQLMGAELKGPDGSVHDIFSKISEQSHRAAEVVARLRKLARSGTNKKAPHDIRSIIENTLVLFDHELKKTGTTLQINAPDTISKVFVDEIQIQQVLVNLVKNSLDALAESGVRKGKVEIAITEDESNLVISVIDNGIGVSEENLTSLFDAFFTSKPKGIGLGLSICRSIASAHGGTLVYMPTTTGGATFTLSLPLFYIG